MKVTFKAWLSVEAHYTSGGEEQWTRMQDLEFVFGSETDDLPKLIAQIAACPDVNPFYRGEAIVLAQDPDRLRRYAKEFLSKQARGAHEQGDSRDSSVRVD